MTARSLACACVTFAMLVAAAPSFAADIVVDADCALTDAITAANTDEAAGGCVAGAGADVITLSADETLDAELPRVTSQITVEGGGYSISGAEAYRIFYVEASGTLTIERLTLRDGRSGPQNAPDIWTGDGGAMFNEGKLIVTDSIFSHNVAGIGGAISNGGTLHVSGSTFVENASYAGPGAIDNLAGSVLTVRESRFLKNEGHFGGAIASSGALLLADSVLDRNRADSGGAIHSIGQSTIERSNITRNFAEGGGAIINSGEQSIANSLLSENEALQEGGAVLNFGNLDVTRTMFARNIAGAGGHLVFYGESTEFNPNYHPYVTGWGGAVYNVDDGKLIVRESSFAENAAGYGGAVFSIGALNVMNTSFSGNGADKSGGALFLPNFGHGAIDSTLSHLTFADNSADHGGGIRINSSPEATVRLYASILADNAGGDCVGGLTHAASNLIEDGSCDAVFTGDPMLGDFVQPEDGGLAYYPLQTGSPAIDAARSDHCPETDQIGAPRPQGDACDIGAIEFVPEQ